VLAVAGAAIVGGLAGWLLAAAFGTTAPQRQPGARPPAASRAKLPASRTVAVNAGALAGQPVREVSQLLHQFGLHPRVIWAINPGAAPGTVLSVDPAGPVPAGSLITVTAVRAPPSHPREHPGDGNSQGNNGGGD
jgi:hypothetical protein